MALTVGLTGDWMVSNGNRRKTYGTIAFDSSYPTGGEPITAANVGLGVLDDLQVHPTAGFVFEWNKTTGKILVYVEEAVAAGGALLEVADTTNLSTLTGVRFQSLGA